MKIVDTHMESEVFLIANERSHADPDKRRAMEDVRTILLGAIDAQGRVLIKLNVAP
jgi:ATP phosphoribosyltransferase